MSALGVTVFSDLRRASDSDRFVLRLLQWSLPGDWRYVVRRYCPEVFYGDAED